jgi:hypothetical protein
MFTPFLQLLHFLIKCQLQHSRIWSVDLPVFPSEGSPNSAFFLTHFFPRLSQYMFTSFVFISKLLHELFLVPELFRVKHSVDLDLYKLKSKNFINIKFKIEVNVQVRYADKRKNDYYTKRRSSTTEICLHPFLFSIPVGYFVSLSFMLNIFMLKSISRLNHYCFQV